MRFVSVLFALSLIPALAAQADPAGYRALSMLAPHYGRVLQGAVWYPVDQPGREVMVAGNAVFLGVTVPENAPMTDGKHPLVMLSHGLGSHFRSLAWLAAGLAERGAIVIGVNHPNSTWGDFDLEAMLNHWTRVQDLTLLLDRVLSDPEMVPHVDPDRIMVAGFPTAAGPHSPWEDCAVTLMVSRPSARNIGLAPPPVRNLPWPGPMLPRSRRRRGLHRMRTTGSLMSQPSIRP
ncbi:MAG: hypothetical protein J4G15_17155 [Alphaproteobacteria bacterium]|nr:hypothetical protein [Alphaproteobacteria bacterium]